MLLSQRLPLHRLCTRSSMVGGFPHPVFTGRHLMASNGIAAVWLDVTDTDLDVPGMVPKKLVRAAHEQDGEDAHIDVGNEGVKLVLFDGAVECFRATCPPLAMPALDTMPEPPAPTMAGRGVARVAINAAQLHKLAAAMGANGKDQAVLLEMLLDKVGACVGPIRVTPFGGAGESTVVGSIAPFSLPAEGEGAQS